MTLTLLAMLCVIAALQGAEPRPIVEFQRAADSYAFLHRQAERRLGMAHQRSGLGAAIDATALANAIIVERTRAPQPPLFTAPVVAAFRQLAVRALYGGCDTGELRTGVWELSHEVNSPASGTRPISECLASVLPALPDELEYRSAGTVLLLVDPHANLVVDVLPALLAGSDIR